MDITKWMQSYERKHPFSVPTHLDHVHQPMNTPTKSQYFSSFFIFYSAVSQKMGHFDISFACSIFSKSWDVTIHGFLGVAHLPFSQHQVPGCRGEHHNTQTQRKPVK